MESSVLTTLRRSRRRAMVFVALAGLVIGVAGCGRQESLSRTKNAALATTTTTTKSSGIVLTSDAGLIGYPLRLEASSPSPLPVGFVFSTNSTGCRIDKYLKFLYYESSTQGVCRVDVRTVSANSTDSGIVEFWQQLASALKPLPDKSFDVTFYPQAVSSSLRKGLVGYWPFNSASTLGWDVVTNTENLKANGKPSFRQVGKFGGAATFNGSTDFLSGKASGDSLPNLPTGNSAYTMSMWMLPKQFDGSRGLMGWGTYGSSGDRKSNAFRLKGDFDKVAGYVPGGLVNYWWGKDLTWDANNFYEAYKTPLGVDVCCRSAFTKTKWVHVAVTYDGTRRRIYYNGIEKASDTPGVALDVSNANFRLGATKLGEYFGGAIDDAAVWSRALSADEVSTLSRTSLGQNNAALPAAFRPFNPEPCDVQGGFCEVGDTSPSGGTVFYVGDFVDQLTMQPMRYLEFAPDDLRTQIAGLANQWMKGYEELCGGSVHPIPEADQSGIGWGRRNTAVIATFCKSGAADKMFDFKFGGSTDWFIPSERELNELCKFVRGQRVGDTSVDCDGTGVLMPDWAMDKYHGYFVSSTQGKVVSGTLALITNALSGVAPFLSTVLVAGQKSGLLDGVNWGDMQQWRVGFDFLKGSRLNLDGNQVQVRPIRAFGPGSQAPLVLQVGVAGVGESIPLSTSGGSGSGKVRYQVSDGGSAKCVLSGGRLIVTASQVGLCRVVAVKGPSEGYFRAVSADQLVTVSQGKQAPLVFPEINAVASVAFTPSISGGSGTGAYSVSVSDSGTAKCAMVSGSATDVVASAAGTCTISATRAGDANYLASSVVTATVKVGKRKQVDLVVAPATGGLDVEIPLTATGGSGSGAVTFTVSDAGATGCVVVAGKNAVVAGTGGDCRVTATKAGDAGFDSITSAVAVVKIANPVCGDSGTRPDGTPCQVGDTGPGGGRVFYVSPTSINSSEGVSAGGVYLEVAPPQWSGAQAEPFSGWCKNNLGQPIGSAIGTGAANTSAWLKFGTCFTNSAVETVTKAVVNGKDDWFVPSSKEMNEVCKFMRGQAVGDPAVSCNNSGSLRTPFVGGRLSGAAYWTSTEAASRYGTSTLVMNMDTGATVPAQDVNSVAHIRPIRAFGVLKPK